MAQRCGRRGCDFSQSYPVRCAAVIHKTGDSAHARCSTLITGSKVAHQMTEIKGIGEPDHQEAMRWKNLSRPKDFFAGSGVAKQLDHHRFAKLNPGALVRDTLVERSLC